MIVDRLLTKSFTQNFKERYRNKKKKSSIKSEKFSPRTNTQGKICQRHEFIRITRFSEGVIGVAKILSSFEKLYGRIFLTEFGGTFFCWLFSRCLFFFGEGENTPGKNAGETQSMKIQVKSGEILVPKNVGTIMQNANSPRVHLHRQS